jgi:hypothetical protein
MVSEHDSAQYILWRRLVGERRRICTKIYSNELKAGCLSVPAFLDLQVPKVFTLESEDPDWDPLRSGITSAVVCYFRVHERGKDVKAVLTGQILEDFLGVVCGLLLVYQCCVFVCDLDVYSLWTQWCLVEHLFM